MGTSSLISRSTVRMDTDGSAVMSIRCGMPLLSLSVVASLIIISLKCCLIYVVEKIFWIDSDADSVCWIYDTSHHHHKSAIGSKACFLAWNSIVGTLAAGLLEESFLNLDDAIETSFDC